MFQVVDNTMINDPKIILSVPAKGVEGLILPVQSSGVIADDNRSHALAVNTATRDSTPSSFVGAFNPIPQGMIPSSNAIPVADNIQPALLTLGVQALPDSSNTVQVLQELPSSLKDAPAKHITSFKRIERSESENELELSLDNTGMNLMTLDDSKSKVLLLLH
jgi:hypothetical protein